ncbi:WD40/YVTN/BNR-like repeat-containing protein [Chitinophaga defluvii]|uniref:Oxidoreductase n=1 Tax=Chitinophaga defluvii TaxID=3163343 RepID=A0ABV2T4E9_9BACT
MKMMAQSRWQEMVAIRSCLKRSACLLLLLLFTVAGNTQSLPDFSLKTIATAPIKSIRGLSIAADQSVWVSGTGGMVGYSTNHGKDWQWMQVTGCDSCDWRSIKAFSRHKAIVMNAGAPAHIFLTENGGKSWQRVYFDDTQGIFFDGLSFVNNQEGVAIGDPMQGKFAMLHTVNGGKSWTPRKPAALPEANPGEALFAASGTGILALPGEAVYFATGGTTSRFFRWQQKAWHTYPLPLIQGESTTGAFSIAFRDAQHGITVGGNYQNDALRTGNCALTHDGGISWAIPAVSPHGYRSCVAYITPQLLVATGPSGTDLSADGGKHWYNISKEGFHVVQTKEKSYVYLAGAGGRIAKLVIGKSLAGQ